MLLRSIINYKLIANKKVLYQYIPWCPRGESNSHVFWTTDFESAASANSATGACEAYHNHGTFLVNRKVCL